MRLADTTRPPSKPDSTPGQTDIARVDGYSVTPAEGLDTSELPTVPMHPEEVLTLLKARLALDSNDRSPVLTGTVPHEAASSAASTWPPVSGTRGKVPSYPDITPSPIVIGLTDDEDALRSNIDAAAAACELPQDWREPAAKDTPAEPIASVRVRQAANVTSEDKDAAPTGTASLVEPLYFPPMKPPESWGAARFDEPLVHVVPDCDAKTRTARSLRRPSSRPAPPPPDETQGWRWALLLTGSALTIVILIGILVAPSIRPQRPILASPGAPFGTALNSISSEPIAAATNPTSASSWPDSGAISTPAADEYSVPQKLSRPQAVPVPSANPAANSSHRSDAPKVTPAQRNKAVPHDSNPIQPPSPGKDGLVF
jgi:hypothetical protein